MYEEFYNLNGCPFRMTPDQRFYYNSDTHRKALAYLEYGLQQEEGFIVITGDVGAGKSTLISCLLSSVDKNTLVPAHIGMTHLEPDDLLKVICSALFIKTDGCCKADMLTKLGEFVSEQHSSGKRVLLIIDEVQNLPMNSLEELRMLSNYTNNNQALLQIFLIGQKQFLHTIRHESLIQLRQRINAFYTLETLTKYEVAEYIAHRLSVAGYNKDPKSLFLEDAIDQIYIYSQGIPRVINHLCNRTLLYGSINSLNYITSKDVGEVINDIENDIDTGTYDNNLLSRPARNTLSPPTAANTQELGSASAHTTKNITSVYSPYLSVTASEEIVSALSDRIDNLEKNLQEHEKALQELINVAVLLLSDSNHESPLCATTEVIHEANEKSTYHANSDVRNNAT